MARGGKAFRTGRLIERRYRHDYGRVTALFAGRKGVGGTLRLRFVLWGECLVRLDWPGCVNVRDLGDLPTTDGHRTRKGSLIRSDNHARLTPDGVDVVRAVKPSRILDVRSMWEAGKYPSPFAGDPAYRNTPVSSIDDPDCDAIIDDYLWIVDANREMVAAAIAALAEAPPGAVVVHCNAGMDRAGIVTALALTEAGVATDTIVADYALSENADPDIIVDVLDHLDRAYGGPHPYLRSAGIDEAHLAAIRTRLRD
jgi:protein-tyrosine phosphatase